VKEIPHLLNPKPLEAPATVHGLLRKGSEVPVGLLPVNVLVALEDQMYEILLHPTLFGFQQGHHFSNHKSPEGQTIL
jgi:hypothetical protein